MKHPARPRALAALLFIAPQLAAAGDFDWPQWQGAQRDRTSAETGLLEEWPQGGPPLAWKMSGVGGGYGAPAVIDGKLYGISKIDGQGEVVWARSEKDGAKIWQVKIADAEEGGMRQGIEGAGCTPTVDGDRLYAISHGGEVVCLELANGEIVWRRSMVKDFGGRLPVWRFNESPLVDGDQLICTPGGTEATLVALDKTSGELIWKSSISDEAAGTTPPATPTPARGGSEQAGAGIRPAAGAGPEVLVANGATWKYFDKGASPGPGWTKPGFDDGAWGEGAAQLGYGDGDEKTKLDDAAANYPTYYFRTKFEVEEPATVKPLIVRLLRDDGAVVHLNGEELLRDNMPEGAVGHGTFSRSVTPSESGFYVHDLDAGKLVAGTNTLAVEVHQASADSSDVSFDLELREKVPGRDRVGAPPRERRGFGGRGGRGGRGFASSAAGYSSAIAVEVGGERQYVQLTAKTLAGVSASDGKLLWRFDRPANNRGINCSSPIFQDGTVFAASAYGNGGARARLKKDGDAWSAEEMWFSGDMENHHGGMLVIDGCLYGANGGNGGGYLTCIDFETGETLWDERDGGRRAEKGSIAYADRRIYYRTEDGLVLLVEPSREEYIERGRFEQPDRTRQPAWTHPVVANGKLYIRDQDTLYCYDVKGTE